MRVNSSRTPLARVLVQRLRTWLRTVDTATFNWMAICGAEPIRYDTLKRFAECFAPCGFTLDSFYPSYGLGEATLIVSGYAEVGGIPENLPRLTKPFRQADLAASVAEIMEAVPRR